MRLHKCQRASGARYLDHLYHGGKLRERSFALAAASLLALQLAPNRSRHSIPPRRYRRQGIFPLPALLLTN